MTYQFMPKGWNASAGTVVNALLLQEYGFVRMWSSVATDLSHVYFMRINLRSE